MERGRQCFTSLRSKLLETASSQKSTTLHLRGHPGRSRTLLCPPAGPEGDSRGLRGCQPTTLPEGPADPHGGRRRTGNLKCCFGKAGKCGRAGRITGGPERGREADPYPGLRPAWATPSAVPGGPMVMAMAWHVHGDSGTVVYVARRASFSTAFPQVGTHRCPFS